MLQPQVRQVEKRLSVPQTPQIDLHKTELPQAIALRYPRSQIAVHPVSLPEPCEVMVLSQFHTTQPERN